MTKATIFILAALSLSISVTAQTANSTTADSSEKQARNQVTVTGCVAKQSTDYVLIQTDPGNTYELERPRKMHLKQYLGKQVEITGTKFPSMPTSSDYLARTGSGSPVTIRIKSIKTISDRCSAY